MVAAPAVLGAVGFTAGGVAAGSVAASIQSVFYGGYVASGSAFALAQSAGAAGIGVAGNAAIGGITAGITGGFTALGSYMFVCFIINRLAFLKCILFWTRLINFIVSSSSFPFPFEGNRALCSLSPSFSVFRTTTGFCPVLEPKFASFPLYRSSPCLPRPASLTSFFWGPC